MAVRDAIAAGEEVGPRTYVAGNILGWEGPGTRRAPPRSELTFFQEQLDDLFTLGTAIEFNNLTPDELRVAMSTYLDRGPDFIKYNGTSHSWPALISFSPRAQRVIVEETHKRGLIAETHSTSLEGLRLSLLAGIDLVQHPENVGLREITDELVDLIVERGVICSLLPKNTREGYGNNASSSVSRLERPKRRHMAPPSVAYPKRFSRSDVKWRLQD